MIKKLVFIAVILLTLPPMVAQDSNCDYFGLAEPGTTPADFDPQMLHLGGSFKYNVEFFNCDELYFTTIMESEVIYFSKKVGGRWTKPQRASFSHPRFNDADPFLTKDGKRMYFISKRPTHQDDKNLDFNIWFADRNGDDWAPPQPLPKPINTENNDEYFFSISDKGNAFFASSRPGGQGSFDIYTTKILGPDQFAAPQNLGSPISSRQYEFDPYIAPDESFMIYSINQQGNSSLFYSVRDAQGQWTTPKNLGEAINVTQQDFAPSLSPDGKYIFFSNNGKLRWVSVAVLELKQ